MIVPRTARYRFLGRRRRYIRTEPGRNVAFFTRSGPGDIVCQRLPTSIRRRRRDDFASTFIIVHTHTQTAEKNIPHVCVCVCVENICACGLRMYTRPADTCQPVTDVLTTRTAAATPTLFFIIARTRLRFNFFFPHAHNIIAYILYY